MLGVLVIEPEWIPQGLLPPPYSSTVWVPVRGFCRGLGALSGLAGASHRRLQQFLFLSLIVLAAGLGTASAQDRATGRRAGARWEADAEPALLQMSGEAIEEPVLLPRSAPGSP